MGQGSEFHLLELGKEKSIGRMGVSVGKCPQLDVIDDQSRFLSLEYLPYVGSRKLSTGTVWHFALSPTIQEMHFPLAPCLQALQIWPCIALLSVTLPTPAPFPPPSSHTRIKTTPDQLCLPEPNLLANSCILASVTGNIVRCQSLYLSSDASG